VVAATTDRDVTATAVGNLTMLPARGPPLMFAAQNFEKAANVALVQP
jgi:hypothetical protein